MKKRILLIFLVIVIFYIGFGIVTALSVKKAVNTLTLVSNDFKSQNLDGVKTNIKLARSQFQTTQKIMIVAAPLRIIPLVGWYVADGQRGISAAISGLDAASTLADAITPYADVLGLKGKGTFLGGTAQERMAKAIEALSKVGPQLDSVAASLGQTKNQIDQIQSWRYPNFLPGHPADKIDNIKKGLDGVESFLTDSRPLLLVLPQIMGQDSEKHYLVLFQNDKELRPTGGFITAYAYFRVAKGVIISEGSDNIYNLDNSLLKRVAAPAPIAKYLNVSNLNLRDSNFSPDYLASMKTFESLYQSTSGSKKIDGIISLDTDFVISMMNVLGPIDAYGSKFTTDKVDACGCAQIIYELEQYADQPVNYDKGARKDIIGVLMQQLMQKAFNAPKGQWPNLLEAIINNLHQKHLLLYFHDSTSQDAVEKINFAGRLYNYDGDYLHINEANLGGAKSNLYVEEKANLVVKQGTGGALDETLTIDYKYPRQMDNCSLDRTGGLCLAGIYQDYMRVYVPLGAKLIKSSGSEVAFTAAQDLDKTVFAGFFTVRPQGTAKIVLQYSVPVKTQGQYKLLIQKQPGTDNIIYDINALGHHESSFPLTNDKELVIKL
ncbi:MAG: DUF4012 domain-containing protein [Candidatus Paceibacterales bacterium]